MTVVYPASPWAVQITPDGVSALAVAAEEGDAFQVVPLQEYTVTALVWVASTWPQVVLGMFFQDGAGNSLGSVYGTFTFSGSVPGQQAGAWASLETTVQAPAGARLGWPLVGEAGTPPSSAVMYAQEIVVAYESGSATVGDYLLDYEHLWQILYNGKVVFEFLGESVQEQLVDETEERLATITGPSTIQVLTWGAAMPPGFPHVVFKTDGIQDGFAEIDDWGNLQLDTNIWNACTDLIWPYPTDGTTGNPLDPYSVDPNSLEPPPGNTYGNESVGEVPQYIVLNPSGTAQLTAQPTGTIMGAELYDITSSSISAQVTPMTGSTLDGSQVTQFYVQQPSVAGNYALIGLSATDFYCEVGNAVPEPGAGPVPAASALKVLSPYDPNADIFWRISEHDGIFYFWASQDGQTWTQLWSHAHSWAATELGVFFSALYDNADGTIQTVGITNLNSEIITPSSAGNIFLGEPIMSVWRQLLADCQARGTMPWVTTALSTVTDSYGLPWTDAMSVQIQNGTDLYSLLQSHTAIVNADYLMQPGFRLLVGLGNILAGEPGVGRDLSGEVILRESAQETTKQRTRARDSVHNLLGAVNSDGIVVTASDAASIRRYQQREGWVETAQTVNPQSMSVVIGASLDQSKDESLQWTMAVLPDRPGATVFQDYDTGDWVGLERPGPAQYTIDAVRTVGIAVSGDATGLVTCELTLNSYRQWLQQQLAYLVTKFGGGFVESLGTTPVTSASVSTNGFPVVTAPNLGNLANVTTGTTHQDPLVFNALANKWQNASNPLPSGSPLGLAIGQPDGSQVTLQPAVGNTVAVDGGMPGTVLAAYQMQSGADSETVPGYLCSVVFSAGMPSEQLGMLQVSGLAQATAQAVLMTSDSADGTVKGRTSNGTVSPGTGGVTWAFMTSHSVIPSLAAIQVAPSFTLTATDPSSSTGAPESWHEQTSFSDGWTGSFFYLLVPVAAGSVVFVQWYLFPGAVQDDTQIFTLPAPYQPNRQVRLPGSCDQIKAGGGGFEGAHIRIESGGDVHTWGCSVGATFLAGAGFYPRTP